MYELEKSDKYKTKLKRCDIESCKGMCCYDGVYLLDGEKEYITAVVERFKDFFSFLPSDYIIDGNWKDIVTGRKTAIRVYTNVSKEFPEHFNKTLCVFADNEGKCSLQKLAFTLNIHKWTFKPVGCWMHPLRIYNGKIIPPPKEQKDDPDYFDESYPGYLTYTSCGKYRSDGEMYDKVLNEEIEFIQKIPMIPYWPNLDKNIDEIIKENSKLLSFINKDT